LGYEALFRGVLLFPMEDAFGRVFTLTLNASFYALAHVYKGLGETVGSLLLGFILAYISLETGNFLWAFVFHVIMAFSNTIFSFYHNPTMQWQK
jgi:membrane protease YdiL (CAAX protease family)